jgi:hypothetical protein
MTTPNDVGGPKTQAIVEFSAHQHRGFEEVERMRRRAPARIANASRNAQAGRERRRRWQPARDALWGFVTPVLDQGTRVAIVGAGNGDDLPLRRIARRAAEVVLIDIDPIAVRAGRRRLPRAERAKVEVIGHDLTAGAADRIALAALADARVAPSAVDLRHPSPNAVDLSHLYRRVDLSHLYRRLGRPRSGAAAEPLPGAPFDLVIGDLFYSQLLYPALLDLGVEAERREAVLAEHAPSLTRAAVARLHASAPRVVHVHDPLAWWDGHEQPVSLDEVLDRAASDGPETALSLAARGNGPQESDPRAALADLGLAPAATALWRWPFSDGVDYLACATLVAGGPPGS